MVKKITVGFVVQTYGDHGKCVAQEFVAGDQVDWEDEAGESVASLDVHQYQDEAFTMQQPTQTMEAIYTEIAVQTQRIREMRQRFQGSIHRR